MYANMSTMVDLQVAMACGRAREYAIVQGITLERMALCYNKGDFAKPQQQIGEKQ